MNNNINILPTNLTPFKANNEEKKENNSVSEVIEDTVVEPNVVVEKHENEITDESDFTEVKDMSRTIEIEEEDITVEGGNEYADTIILDNYDTTKQNDSISTYEFNDEDIRNVFYGSSLFQHKKNEIKENSDLFTVFDFYRKESRYKDVYLPVTNVAVRIYEFNNLDILINKMRLESEKDLNYI